MDCVYYKIWQEGKKVVYTSVGDMTSRQIKMEKVKMEKAMADCMAISEGKFKDSNPDLKKNVTSLATLMKTAFESLIVAREDIVELRQDVSDLKELDKKVTDLGTQVTNLGEKMTGLGEDIQRQQKNTDAKLDKHDQTMKKAMEALTGIDKKLGEEKEAREKYMEEERESREKYMEEVREAQEREKRLREEAEIEYESSQVAPNLILYGFKMEEDETNRDLMRNIERLFYEVIGLNRDVVIVEKVVRFGGKKAAETAAGAVGAATSARPRRPPLVRVVLADQNMKGTLFKGLNKLKGNETYKDVSIQNEIPKSLMDTHKQMVERAKMIRTDTGYRTRIAFGKEPLTLKVFYEGKFRPEAEFNKMYFEKEGKGSGTSNDGSFKPRWADESETLLMKTAR